MISITVAEWILVIFLIPNPDTIQEGIKDGFNYPPKGAYYMMGMYETIDKCEADKKEILTTSEGIEQRFKVDLKKSICVHRDDRAWLEENSGKIYRGK